MQLFSLQMNKTLKIHVADNIEVALENLAKDTAIGSNGITYHLVTDVPAKHKFAIQDFEIGDNIIMYGVLVGKATQKISKGELISTQNITHASNSFALHERKTDWHKPDLSAWANKTFMGYPRKNGSVGTRNYWLIIPLVFCENQNVKTIQEAFEKELGYHYKADDIVDMQVKDLVKLYREGKTKEEIAQINFEAQSAEAQLSERLFPNVDGIKFLNHTLGCGGTKDDAKALCGLLAGYITHPNVAGATVLSLGCQNAQVAILKDSIYQRDALFSKPLIVLEQQEIGSEAVLLKRAVKETFLGLMEVNSQSRQPASLDKLCIGLECGGSDGFSGLSANPALGMVSDIVVAMGGSVILSEFPELCGVEQELSDRCVTDEVAERFMHLMTTYQSRARAVGSGFESNPSPGNVRDGLITDAIKSAGAARKGGSSPVTDVLDYPEKVTKPGLNLLCTPGSDVESTTAEVGAGANIVVFTTGLGTPTGNPVTPVLKVATNTALYNKMNDIIDINAGTIIDGAESLPQMAERMLNYIIDTASGIISAKADTSDHNDFIPWKRGISL
jgi:altronate hydrolase